MGVGVGAGGGEKCRDGIRVDRVNFPPFRGF